MDENPYRAPACFAPPLWRGLMASMGRLQFSIRFLLLVTAIAAVGTAAARAEQSVARTLSTLGLTLLFATASVVGVCQTAGIIRVFWIGAAIVLCPLAFFSVQISVYFFTYGQQAPNYASYSFWPIWCIAPVNGILAVVLNWIFSPLTHVIRLPLPRPTIIASAIFSLLLLLLLGAAFFGGMLFGERRERVRRDQEEVEFERKWRLPVEAAE